jgi:lysozyme
MNKEQLIQDWIAAEGGRPDMYKDTKGLWTIGYGWNIQERPMRKSEMMFRLTNDMEETEQEMDARIGWWRSLPSDAQNAVFEMFMNMGWPSFSQFKKMIAALQVGDYEEAAVQALDSKWKDDVGPTRSGRIADMIRNA